MSLLEGKHCCANLNILQPGLVKHSVDPPSRVEITANVPNAVSIAPTTRSHAG
jgi:hypothetical protein